MSNKSKKKDLDLVIEDTLKENGIIKENKKPKKVSKKIEKDLVKESTTKLALEASDSSNVNLLKEDMDSFKRLINHRI
jgi:hypothetical protein